MVNKAYKVKFEKSLYEKNIITYLFYIDNI